MKKRKRNVKRSDPDADLDEDISDFRPSDSDDDYDDNEKLLLEKARKGKNLGGDDDFEEEDSDEEEDVLGIYSSDEEKAGKANDDSDIEGLDDDRIPDSKAWGRRKKDYYHTDYVDQDYGGFSKEGEETVALMEEKEARTLQSRLAAQLDDVDLSLGFASKSETIDDEQEDDKEEDLDSADFVQTDLSKLTKREKLALFEKESPEFFGLINDYKERLTYAKDTLLPILKLIRSGRIKENLPCSKFINLKTQITMNYCVNLVFYLLLKKKRIKVKDHPVTERLLTYRDLLQQLDSVEKSEYVEQVNDIIKHINDDKVDDLFPTPDDLKASTKLSGNKRKLKLLTGSEEGNESSMKRKTKPNESLAKDDELEADDLLESMPGNYSDLDEDSDDAMSIQKNHKLTDDLTDENEKRGITYEMAKNKGLTPHRKKEQRNPRVKNRNKYRKALIRRKGQVRQTQTEVKKYGGEIFGIKASVIKSRKLK